MLLKLKKIAISALSLIVLSYLTFLMINICLQYFPWASDTNFLVLKQDVVANNLWLTAFQIHVISSSFALFAGFTQFFQFFRKNKWKKIHHYAGYLYFFTIICFSLPSGFILALYALGGTITQMAFIILSLLWGVSTLLALYFALKKQWILHRDWMIRSYALTLSALSLRTWKIILYEFSPYWDWLTPLHIYQLESWLGWTVNLLIAEIIIIKLHQKSAKSSLW